MPNLSCPPLHRIQPLIAFSTTPTVSRWCLTEPWKDGAKQFESRVSEQKLEAVIQAMSIIHSSSARLRWLVRWQLSAFGFLT